ncbi:MAG TPA: hypothetical protein VN714_35285 [Trebonia sp.]|nr:hypothetical protein [Trebonia sp.]
MTSPSEQAPTADLPQRVTTLELFFDLVFRLHDHAAHLDARLGPVVVRLDSRAAAAALALVAWPLAVEIDAATGIALLTVVVAGALAVERRGEHATVEA